MIDFVELRSSFPRSLLQFIHVTRDGPVEGNYLLINKTLVEATALLVLYVFPTGNIIGVDRLIFCNKINPVKS